MALRDHSRLPPPAPLGGNQAADSQTRNVLKFKYIWWVGDTSSDLPGPPGLVAKPSQRAMSLSTNTSLAAEGWGWGADSQNKAAFNWPEREWQGSRAGGRLPAGQEEQV